MREEIIGKCRVILGDSREVLPTLEKHDAVVTDWPYGIGESAGKAKTRTSGLTSKLRSPQIYRKDYGDEDWDDKPIDDELVKMVMSAGKWNILFGGNYYALPATSCWLIWDKLNGDTDFADCEMAWTNLPKAVRRIRYLWNGCMRANGETRDGHPTQKPLGVMEWCLNHLPKGGGNTIIDPFAGSFTTAVACVRQGRSFTGIERNAGYFEIGLKRIEEAYKQPSFFNEPESAKSIQDSFL